MFGNAYFKIENNSPLKKKTMLRAAYSEMIASMPVNTKNVLNCVNLERILGWQFAYEL